MAQKNVIQLNNVGTYCMYMRVMLNIAENFGVWEGLNSFVDVSFLNKKLVRRGAIAWIYDDVFNDVIPLPFFSDGKLDMYNRPTRIIAYGLNGYQTSSLTRDNFVIMYDNNGKYPIYYDVLQYAARMANMQRVFDINLNQQKTPRVFMCDKDIEFTVKNLMNKIDKNEELILTYDSIPDINSLSVIPSTAPFLCDKISTEKRVLWNEFLSLVGVFNVGTEKKERLVTNEVTYSQTENLTFINNRLQPRLRAIEEIKEKFGKEISFTYSGERVVNELLYNDITDNFGEFSTEIENN